MDWEKLNEKNIKDYLIYKETHNKSPTGVIRPSTKKMYDLHLNYLSDFIKKPFKNVNESDIQKFLNVKSRRRNNNYKNPKPKQTYNNTRISIIQDFYRWLFELDDDDKLPECVRRFRIRKVKKNIIEEAERVISEKEYLTLLEHANLPMQKAMIEALWLTGGRKEAMQSLQSDDVYYDQGVTHIVIRKSKTEPRIIRIQGREQGHLLKWVESLAPYRNKRKKPLFVSKKKNVKTGKNEFTRVNKNYLYNMLQIASKKAGLKNISPHDFRYTRATEFSKQNKPVNYVNKYMGWSPKSNQYANYDLSKLDDFPPEKISENPIIKLSYDTMETLQEKRLKDQEKKLEKLEGANKQLMSIVEDLMDHIHVEGGFEKVPSKDGEFQYVKRLTKKEKRRKQVIIPDIKFKESKGEGEK
jgi:integrase